MEFHENQLSIYRVFTKTLFRFNLQSKEKLNCSFICLTNGIIIPARLLVLSILLSNYYKVDKSDTFQKI